MSSTPIEKLLEDDELEGLSAPEFTLISRLNKVCVWLARERTREDVVDLVRQEWSGTKSAAEKWVAKAEDFLALGIFEDVERSRRLYAHRLQEIYGLCMAHAVKDQVEVTTKPVKVRSEDGKLIQINGQHTKVKPNAFDPNAVAMAMKAAKEIAHISGARPRDSKVSVGNMNVLVNGAGGTPQEATAQTTYLLSNQALADMVGGEIVDAPGSEVLTDQPSPAEEGAEQGDEVVSQPNEEQDP